MTSARRETDRKSVGPLLGLVLFLVLGGAIAFSSWQFLRGPDEEPSTEVSESTPTERAAADQHERLAGGPVRIEDPVRGAEGGEPRDSGSAPTLLQRRTELEKQGLGIDRDTPTYNVVGKVRDSQTGKPVIFFEVFTPLRSDGPPLEAIAGGRSQKFRSQAGEFTLRYLVEGEYNVVVRTTTHEEYVLPGGLSVPHEGVLDVALERGTWISGLVRDNFGKPLEQKEVHIQPRQLDPGHRSPRRRIARTDDLGYFEFTQLPPGTYSMFVGSPQDPDAQMQEFYLAEDEHLDRSFAVDRQTTLKFLLTNQYDKPIPRARVTLVSKTNQRASKASYSNIQGEARIAFVKPGEYSLVIKAAGYEALEEETYYVRGGDLLVEVPRMLTLSSPPDR